jgi:glycosyltransferase involved in cell wall biosynthesis
VPSVLVIPSFYPTAALPHVGTFFREYAQMMRRAGWRTSVCYTEPRSLRDLSPRALRESHFQPSTSMENGITTRRLHGWNPGLRHATGGRVWARLTAALALRWMRGAGRPDVLHAHNALWAGEAARLIARTSGIPYVVTEHSSQVLMRETSRAQQGAAVDAWRGAAAVAAVSRPLADVVAQSGQVEAQIIPNPVDVDFFVPPTDRRGPPESAFVTVANLNANKGVHVLLEAFAQVVPARPDASLDIVGDGPERRALEALADSLGVTERVTFHGALDRAAVRALLWKSSCFVSTSRHETFGIAIAEALATGLPVVATRSGGPDELLADGAGRLVPRDDVHAIAEAMRDLVVPTPAARACLRQRIVDRCAPAVVAEQYAVLFRRALTPVRSPSR